MARIEYCRKSNISEAWAAVLGLPGPYDDTDAPAIKRQARNQIPGMELRPAVVALEIPPYGPVAPFWSQQLQWDGGSYMSRFGHRYLSVHYLRRAGHQYSTYSETLRPWTTRWLDVYSAALGPSAKNHVVDHVGFGYVNSFTFDAKNFDLSRYFRLNIAVDVGDDGLGLHGLKAVFHLHELSRLMELTVEIEVDAPPESSGQLSVITKVVAQGRRAEELSFADSEALHREISGAKDAAKEAFFGFATDETHAILEAVEHAATSAH